MATTNMQQWNPLQNNQESDAGYTADAQRANGAAANDIFASPTANKLFNLLSNYWFALASALVNKGYTTDDSSIATLTSQFQSSIVTFADLTALGAKSLSLVTQTGDTSAHTIFTLAIPPLGATQQLRIFIPLRVNSVTNNVTILVKFGGTTISAPVAVTTGANKTAYLEVVGGNLNLTNSQSWDTMTSPLLANAAVSNLDHQTSVIDTSVSQNLTVTYQGANNSDSVTFYKCLVQIF